MAGPFDPIPGARGVSPLTLISECETVAQLDRLQRMWVASSCCPISEWPPRVSAAWQDRYDRLFRAGATGEASPGADRLISHVQEAARNRQALA